MILNRLCMILAQAWMSWVAFTCLLLGFLTRLRPARTWPRIPESFAAEGNLPGRGGAFGFHSPLRVYPPTHRHRLLPPVTGHGELPRHRLFLVTATAPVVFPAPQHHRAKTPVSGDSGPHSARLWGRGKPVAGPMLTRLCGRIVGGNGGGFNTTCVTTAAVRVGGRHLLLAVPAIGCQASRLQSCCTVDRAGDGFVDPTLHLRE